MSPQRVAGVVAWWVRAYTAGLPAQIRDRRIEEIDADLVDHIAHGRAHGASESKIAFEIAMRLARGAASDVSWRTSHVRASRGTEEPSMHPPTLARSAVRVALFVVGVLMIPVLGSAWSDEVTWTIADYVAAGTLLSVIGIAIEVAVRRAGNILVAAGIAGVGLAAVWVGEVDDAPGLVLLGGLLIATAAAIVFRRPAASTRPSNS